MSRFWSPKVASLKPYVPGEQPRMPGLVKLNTNESPYGPSPRALDAIRAATNDDLRLYPDPESAELRRAIGAAASLPAEWVFVGNGSDEVLAHAFAGLLAHERPILAPDITYSFYPVYARLFDTPLETVPLDAAFRIRLEDYRRPAGGVVIANPNAPTGVALSRSAIAGLLADQPDIPVIVDEAYVDFGAESAVTLVPAHENLLVVRTFSKSSALAGLRVGYALGQPHLIEALARVKDSFNSYPLGRLAQAGAAAAVEDAPWLARITHAIAAERARLTEGLAQRGFALTDSRANFVFARHDQRPGKDLAQGLRDRAVLVRRFDAPRIGDWLRITVGTPEQGDRLFEALDAVLADGSRT